MVGRKCRPAEVDGRDGMEDQKQTAITTEQDMTRIGVLEAGRSADEPSARVLTRVATGTAPSRQARTDR